MKQKKWIVFALCLLWQLVLLSVPIGNSIYMVPVTEALGLTRAQFSVTFSIKSVINLGISFLFGKFYRRFGIRPMIILGCLCLSLGYGLYAAANSLLPFLLGSVIIGVGVALANTSAISIVLNSWFADSIGTITGIVFAGSSVGGSVFCSLIGRWISQWGYRMSYLISGGVILLSALPLILFVGERPRETAAGGSPAAARPPERSLRQYLRDRDNRRILLVAAVIGFTVYPLEAVIPSRMMDLGYGTDFGANVLGGALLVSTLGKVVMGRLYDRKGMPVTLELFLLLFAVGAALFLNLRSKVLIGLFVLIYGMAVAHIILTTPLIARTALSAEEYGRFVGLYVGVQAAGDCLGVYFINSVYDLSGSYAPAVIVFVALAAIAALASHAPLRRRQALRNARPAGE